MTNVLFLFNRRLCRLVNFLDKNLRNLRNLWFVLLFLPFLLAAQTDVQSEAAYAYGQMMQFRLTAVTPPITQVTLHLQTSTFPPEYIVQPRFTQIDGRLTAQHDLDLTQIPLPPFTAVTYWWTLTTADGKQIEIPAQRFVYRDDRFAWQGVTGDDIIIFWAGEDETLGATAHEITRQTREQLQPVLGLAADDPVTVYVYPSSASLRSGLRLAGLDWQDGQADPRLDVVLVTAVNQRTAASDLAQSLPPAVARLLLFHFVGEELTSLPPWLVWGLAGTDGEASPALAAAVRDGTTIPLTELCQTFPNDQKELAVAQSVSFAAYLQEQFGAEKVGELTAVLAEGMGCDTAVRQVLDTSFNDLESAWLQAIRPPTPLRLFFSQNALWLSLLLISFALFPILVWQIMTRRSN